MLGLLNSFELYSRKRTRVPFFNCRLHVRQLLKDPLMFKADHGYQRINGVTLTTTMSTLSAYIHIIAPDFRRDDNDVSINCRYQCCKPTQVNY